MKTAHIACAGEVMIEMAASDGGTAGGYQQGLAGDSFNTAIYLARAGLAARDKLDANGSGTCVYSK